VFSLGFISLNFLHLQYELETFFFFKILFSHLTERDTAREGTQAGGVGVGEGEAGFPRNREPHAGLNPRTPGS